MNIFDRKLLRIRRNRAANKFNDFSFLKQYCCEVVIDTISDVKRDFGLALDLGCHTGQMASLLGTSGKVGEVISADISEGMLKKISGRKLLADDELLPFADNTFDLITSAFSMHWVNDIPGMLTQIKKILKPDGLFVAAFPGGQTLYELRDSMANAEIKLYGGVNPRVPPFITLRDAAGLLQRVGFALPVADSMMLDVTFSDVHALLTDLRGMGETNILIEKSETFISKLLLSTLQDYYMNNYSVDGSSRINAKFEIIMMMGFK